MLYKEDECTRDVDEGLEVIAKNWRDLRWRLKPILKEIKEERMKESEQNVYLDGIERIVRQIQLQMKTPTTDTNTAEGVSATSSGKTKLLMKPAKVPTWTKDLTLETYTKQLLTWSDILEDISEYIKYADLMESLKTNKEVKGLPRYVGEHVLPTLEKKSDQTILKVLDLLDS